MKIKVKDYDFSFRDNNQTADVSELNFVKVKSTLDPLLLLMKTNTRASKMGRGRNSLRTTDFRE